MPVSILDLVVIGVILLSALLASLRGFTREILAIGSWAVAAAVAYVGYPQALPYVQPYISNATAAVAVSAGAVFLVTLFVAYFITAKLSDLILDSRVGALDRTLGFMFGAARGFVIVVVCFLFFTWFNGGAPLPNAVQDARLRPILESTGATIMSWLPEDPDKFLRDQQQRLRTRGGEGEVPRETVPDVAPVPQRRTDVPQPVPAAPAAGAADRSGLQRLIDTPAPRPQPQPQPLPR